MYNNVRLPAPPDKEALKARRKVALSKLMRFSVVKMALSLVTAGVGIGILIAASENIGFPVFNFGPLLAGAVVFVGAFFAFRAGQLGPESENEDEAPCHIKCKVIGYYCVCVTAITLATLGGVFAFLSAGVCNSPDSPYIRHCFPKKDAIIVLSVIGGVCCLILALLCILGTVFFCVYGRAFGFKSRYERMMERQVAMVMMAHAQGQGQSQGHQFQQYSTQYSGPNTGMIFTTKT